MILPSTDRRLPGAVTLGASLLLLLSPLLLGLEGNGAASAYVLGALGASLGVKMFMIPSIRDGWLAVVAGLLVIALPWVVGFAAVAAALWVHTALGLVVLLTGIWAIWDGRRRDGAGTFHDRNDGALNT